MDLISSSILGPVCERLIDAAVKEYKLVRDVKEEIRNLGSMVRAVRDVLQDAERKKAGTWLKDLKELLLDAEDVLDEIATDEALRAKTDRPFRFLSCLCGVDFTSSSRSIAHQIEDINKRFNDITQLKNELGLHHAPGEGKSPTVIRRSRTLETNHVLGSHAHVIGRADEMAKMRDLLLDDGMTTSDEKNVRVISVVGMGGTGKTTLVKHVYNDPEVTSCFQSKIWVCVSNDFDVKRIIKEIADAISISDSERDKKVNKFKSSNWDATVTFLHDKIRGRKFLLVLDDVWEKDHSKWEVLCDPLSHGAKGSKIIVTTRNKKVSDTAKGTPIVLKDLPKDDLWSIFENYAFDGIHDPDKKGQLASVGMQIVEKLKGSPLAAKIIGRLLNSNMDVRYWTNIMQSETLFRGDGGSILSVLKLSYDHLPGHLKQCFAYCSLFPEDHEFHKGKLVQLWMAQQFINSIVEGSHDESVGGECFDYLVHMLLFEKHTSDDDDDDVHVMHDLIHDLADSVSKDDCLRVKDDHSRAVDSETIRHISIICRSLEPAKLFQNLGQSFKKLRTLLFMKGSELRLSHDHLDLLFRKLQRLRVLGLQSCRIEELPKSIGNLKHLRYLDLSHNRDIKKLPESVCGLHNLRVLDLMGCKGINALPNNMSALINLRYILTENLKVESNIRGLGNLTSLHTLTLHCGRSHEQPILKELEGMAMLRTLVVVCLEKIQTKDEAKAARLHEKKHLEHLILEWERDTDDHHLINPELQGAVLECLRPTSSIKLMIISSYGGIRSPNWMEDPSWVCDSLLEMLRIENCMNWEVLPPLGRLPCLKKLIICQMKHVRRIRPAGDDRYLMNGPEQVTAAFFPSLEILFLVDMEEWEEWEVPPFLQSSLFLPRLQKLRLRDCPKLRLLPSLPPSLKKLKIENVGLSDLPEWRQFSSSSSPPSLSVLKIVDCPSLKSLAVGLLVQPLPDLVKLTIRGCRELVSLPKTAFGHLTSLKEMNAADCPMLSWPTSLPVEDTLPPSLESIHIGTGCAGVADLMMKAIIVGSAKLTSLRVLHIDGCHALPVPIVPPEGDRGSLPSTLEELIIGYNDNLDADSLSAWLRGLTSLRSLSITECSNIVSLPSTEVPSYMTTALQTLKIDNLKGLKSLGGFIHSHNSLEELEICKCPELADLKAYESCPSSLTTSQRLAGGVVVSSCVKKLTIMETSPQQMKTWLLQFPSLQELDIVICPQLMGFGGDDGGDEGGELEAALLNLSTTLRELSFWECENLRSLPPKLRSLSSLESLTIFQCLEIRRLPVGGLPESLQVLIVGSCHEELEGRCKEGGSDWPLISHIPQRCVTVLNLYDP